MGSHQVSKLQGCKRVSNANYSRQLLKAIGRVDGLVTSDEEVRQLMLNRATWRNSIKIIVVIAKNKEVDSIEREDGKIRRNKTRNAIVVI
jgi:hypothetical protein